MNYYAEQVKKNGIVKRDNWLDIVDQKKIENIIKTLKPNKGDTKGIFAVDFITLLHKILKIKFKNIIDSIYLFKLSKKLNLKEIAEEILESKAKLTRIDSYWSPKSNKPVLDWHVDNAYSGRENVKNFIKPDQNAIKFFFYLTDVSTDNGCLSYIPQSHKIAYALKQGIYEGDIKYQKYWTLFDFRKIITKIENFKYLKKKVDEKLILKFLKESELILNNTAAIESFDNEVKKGGALIFDEAGVHRGSKTSLNDRMVLRFFFHKI